MIVVFADPRTGEDREFKFDLDDMDVAQARYIKRNAGLTPKGLYDAMREGDPDALVAMYWLMLAQNGVAADMGKLNFKLVKFSEALADASDSEVAAQLGITLEELRDLASEAEKRDVSLDDLLAERGIKENPTEAPATA